MFQIDCCIHVCVRKWGYRNRDFDSIFSPNPLDINRSWFDFSFPSIRMWSAQPKMSKDMIETDITTMKPSMIINPEVPSYRKPDTFAILPPDVTTKF